MPTRIIPLLCFAALLSSCGGGGGSPATAPPPPAPLPIDFEVTGSAVVKVQSGAHGVAVLEEKLTQLSPTVRPGPDRSIAVLDSNGTVTSRYFPPLGFALIDFAQHPSGEISVALATVTSVRIVRIDRNAVTTSDFGFTDPAAPTDPFYDNGGIHDDNALLPFATRDAVRIAAVGEGLAMALRTGRNAVVAYRLDFAQPAGYSRTWRTLVEPGLSMFTLGITSGSFDTFGQLENHWHVALDADAAGNMAVAVVGKPGLAPVFAAHADFFKQPTNVQVGLIVTRLAPDGQRQGATLIDTMQSSELYGLRLNGDDIALVGRVFTEQRDDGGGWNAYVAHVSRTSGALAAYRLVDVDRGDVLFDIAPLAQGRYLVAGATGYTQNPTGASISEQAAPLLAVLESDGTLRQRIPFATGARQNQLRSIVPRGTDWLVGGMVNGPGTHSGDADPALITADGFVRQATVTVQ